MTISTICIPKSNNNYSRCVESIIRSHYNKRIFLFIKHLHGVKCFLTGSDRKNSILRSNLIKIHSHGPHHAIKFKRLILDYIGIMNKSMQIVLYDTNESYMTIPFYILLRSILTQCH